VGGVRGAVHGRVPALHPGGAGGEARVGQHSAHGLGESLRVQVSGGHGEARTVAYRQVHVEFLLRVAGAERADGAARRDGVLDRGATGVPHDLRGRGRARDDPPERQQNAVALERKGFLEARVDDGDRRSRGLVLTEAHHEFWSERNPSDLAAVQDWVAAWTDSEVRPALGLLRRLYQHLTAQDPRR
jgi:hypothetical protein